MGEAVGHDSRDAGAPLLRGAGGTGPCDVSLKLGFTGLLEGAGTMRPSELKEHLLRALGEDLADDASLVILEVL